MFSQAVIKSLLPLGGREDGRRPDEGVFAESDIFKSLIASVIVLLMIASTVSGLQADEQTPFKTGKALKTALSARVSWTSIGAPLASQLQEFQDQAKVAILRDRRTDPRGLINVETELVPRIQVLKRISESVPGTGYCRTDNFVCVGPIRSVHRLPVLLERSKARINSLRKTLTPDESRKLLSETEIAWPRLTEPRKLFMDRANAAGAEVSNPELIPHDVWDEGRLPKISFAEFATVVLNQFDLTFTVVPDAPTLTIVAIDPETILEHRYSVSRELQTTAATAWRSRMPGLQIKWTGTNTVVTASLDEHAVLYGLLEELRTMKEVAGDSAVVAKSSLLTEKFQLSVKGGTVGQLIDEFRRNGIIIEITDPDTAETKAILSQFIDLDAATDKLPGLEFFPLVFGRHFKRVEVTRDRVVLSRE